LFDNLTKSIGFNRVMRRNRNFYGFVVNPSLQAYMAAFLPYDNEAATLQSIDYPDV